ncbi:type VII secretion target [Nocardia abscessus]|uniref:type VII secretion target n=1 Tax=Nocardia abscessus TaxID=120957 RepID=UPI002457CBC4|nr:type VII secretion target [Nocardia abscessus]
MSEYLDVDPDDLRRIAEKHERVAANIRKWGEIPHAWLAEFPSKHGTIAEPVRAALVDYYDRRHAKAKRLAANHLRTRDELIASAQSLEDADRSGGSQITRAGGFDDKDHRVGPAPGASTDPAPPVNGTRLGEPPAAVPGPPGIPSETGHSHQIPLVPAASTPRNYDAASAASAASAAYTPRNYDVAAAAASIGTVPPPVDRPHSGPADIRATSAADADNVAGMAADQNSVAGPVGGVGAAFSVVPFAAQAVASAAGMDSGMPAPLVAGPFVSAVHAAESRRALPSLVVGQQVEQDLVLARTLLAAILAAVADSASGLDFAVAVGRTPVGPIVVLTSSEGRGWLPPGLFLPSEVVLPWRWDSVLGTAGRGAIAALEGTTDPARILAEFGLMVGRRRRVRISALVSSAAVPDGLRAALGSDVAVEHGVAAAEASVDLTAPGVGLVDRLTLAGSKELLRQAATVGESEIRVKCLELARAADARVRTSVAVIDGEISARRVRRQRILDALHAGLSVPASWWDQLRTADDVAASAIRSRRANSHPRVGARVEVSGAEALRGMVFERRADELLLLLAAGEPGRQTLRDAYYSYGQIVEHPLLPTAARVVAEPATKAIGTTTAVPDAQGAHRVGLPSPGAGPVGVSSISFGGAPRSITEMRNGPAESQGSGVRRRV